MIRKLLFANDGDHYRKWQLIKTQRTSDFVVPKGHIYNTAPVCGAQAENTTWLLCPRLKNIVEEEAKRF